MVLSDEGNTSGEVRNALDLSVHCHSRTVSVIAVKPPLFSVGTIGRHRSFYARIVCASVEVQREFQTRQLAILHRQQYIFSGSFGDPNVTSRLIIKSIKIPLLTCNWSIGIV